jgi:hypothetical protein
MQLLAPTSNKKRAKFLFGEGIEAFSLNSNFWRVRSKIVYGTSLS